MYGDIVNIIHLLYLMTPNKVFQTSETYYFPVEFVYLHPKKSKDGRRWFGGIVRCQKSPSLNVHNHRIHSATKIAQCVREKINNAILANPALTPSDISCGKGLGFIPSAVDGTSSHSGKVSQEVRKTKQKSGLLDRKWEPMNFEEVAVMKLIRKIVT